VASSTAITRRAGTRFHRHTACGLTPTFLARAVGPPATLMAWDKAVSLFFGTNELQHCFRSDVKHCVRGSSDPDNQGVLDAKELSRRIIRAMDEADISGAALAAACKVTPQAVSGWRRTGRIGKRHLTTLSLLTGRPVEFFVADTVPSKNGGNLTKPWLIEDVVDSDKFLVVFRTWQDGRVTDRENLTAIANVARKAHGTRTRKRTS